LQAIIAYIPTNNRLKKIRHVFLFSCFTGLAYSDILRLKKNHLTSYNGQSCIIDERVKSNEEYYIPLCQPALHIIETYADWSLSVGKGKLLPVPANSTYNADLKIIGEDCGIEKVLTTHVARHTFARISLENDLPIETIQRVMGHNDIATTLEYAKTNKKKIVKDMARMHNSNDLYNFAV
jgi:integrase